MKVVTGSAPQPGETPLPDGAAGSSPCASDGPEGEWWRGDPAAAAARFAAICPAEPGPPAPTVTLSPSTAEPDPAAPADPVPDSAPAAGSDPSADPNVEAPASAARDGGHALPETLPEPEAASELEVADPAGPAEELETAALAGSAELEMAGMKAAGRAEADPAVMPPIVVREAGRAGLDARERVRIAWPERVPAPAPEPEERPFWMPVQEMPRGSRRPPVRGRPKGPRRPAVGLLALLVFALLATFFAWVSAEPLWLAVGHGDEGTATVTECTGDGVSQRCLGEFTAASGAFTAERVRLLGVGDQDGAGTTVAARMVGSDSGRAYVDAASDVIHLRWGLGMGLVLLCGIGIVWATGSLRLENGRARRSATLAGLAGPLLVAIAFLAATF